MSLGSSPRSDAGWARDVERRLRQLETPRSVRMGPWMISVSPISGDLVADHIPSGSREVIAAAKPETRSERE